MIEYTHLFERDKMQACLTILHEVLSQDAAVIRRAQSYDKFNRLSDNPG